MSGSTCKWPVSFSACSFGRKTSWPSLRSGHCSRLVARLCVVQVTQLPSTMFCASRYLSTPGVPPTMCRSSIMYLRGAGA